MDIMADLIEKNLRLFCANAETLTEEAAEPEELADFHDIQGASEEALTGFEERFQIRLPEDFRALYRYKNGSGYLPLIWPQEGFYHGYRLLSLEEIYRLKSYFQHEDREISEFPNSAALLRTLDRRVKPHLFCRRWIPFAAHTGSLYLMLDFDPSSAGTAGQIICYIHDPDSICYIAPSITEVLRRTEFVIEGLV